MMGKKPIIGALLVVALAYAVYPYVTLYRLGLAIRHGNAMALQTMVDWPSVREGIKEDICDMVIDQPQQAKRDDRLPPFGAGFMRGIAANAVDQSITPETLVSVAQQPETKQAPRRGAGAAVQVNWAFFGSPTSFVVDLVAPAQASPIRLQMELRDGTWRVTRVWLPPELLAQAHART